ncbi:hypothetical protein OHA25_32000 [Nonomuraea sp. NBC_00507]
MQHLPEWVPAATALINLVTALINLVTARRTQSDGTNADKSTGGY